MSKRTRNRAAVNRERARADRELGAALWAFGLERLFAMEAQSEPETTTATLHSEHPAFACRMTGVK